MNNSVGGKPRRKGKKTSSEPGAGGSEALSPAGAKIVSAFEEAIEAFKESEGGHVHGKLVVRLS